VFGALIAYRAYGQVPGELHGRITDARTARPIQDARIELNDRAEVARSNRDGSFAVRGLEPRDYVVHVRAFGFVALDREITVANGRMASLDVSLEPLPAKLNPVLVQAPRDSQRTNAIVFDRGQIEASGRRDLGELLESSPGVVVTQEGGPGSASRISIRGSSANEVLVLVDGVPINSPITGEADLSHVSLEAVDRVVVRSGAQSARYGGRALAGVVEISTRRASRATSMLLRDGAWGERQISATMGSELPVTPIRAIGSLTGEYRTVRGDFPYAVPALRGGGTAHRINSDVASREVLGGLTIDDESTTIRARGSWSDLSRGLAGSIVQPSATGRQTNSRSSAGVDARAERRGFTWTATGDLTRERSTFVDSAPPFGTAYNDAVTATGMSGTINVTAGHGPVIGSLGGEARTLDVASTMLAPTAPHWQRLLGVWAAARFSHVFDASTRFDADLSARVDESSLIGDAVVSPRAAVALSRGPIVASASVGDGYAPPSLADQFFHEGVLVRANPALRPERTTGDAEARISARDVGVGPLVLNGDAAAFRANVDGMILWFPDFQFIWSPSNVAVRRSGWELSGRAALPGQGIDLQGTLNRADVVYAGPVLDGQVPYRPRTTASITAASGVYWGRLELANRYVSSRRTVPGSALNSLDPYWLTDARWTTSSALSGWLLDLSVGVENLMDRPAAMLVDYPFPGRTWSVSLRVRRSPLS
jgi:outer membrane cobalamin receptor